MINVFPTLVQFHRFSLPLIFFGCLLAAMAKGQDIASIKYSWKKPVKKTSQNLYSTVIFEGSGHDMSYIQMSANALLASRSKSGLVVPANEEYLLLVKGGKLNISLRDSTWRIGAGSIALLLPEEKFSIQNLAKDSATFYLMKYRSKTPMDEARGKTSGRSFVMDWNRIVFKPHDKGGIRKYFERATPMCKRLEMHVTTLNEGLRSHDPHTHAAEEIVLMIENVSEMQLGDQFFNGGPGDIYYLGSNVPHAIRNSGKGTCTYFAFQFD